MTPPLTRIQRLLIKPEVWRFVCLASNIVGLLFFALSHSFNYLIGRWNLFKIFLYSVVSFIICAAVWFAKSWQPSPSPRFKALMSFLFLTITSVFSYFFDKRVAKPDAYSLISCAAFAMMSLSLSRQRQIPCGFEVDLLYFFLAFLMMQFMKIKLLLQIVGAIFSFSLIFLHLSLDGLTENVDLRLQDQNHLAIEMDSLHSNSGVGALLITNQQANTDSAPIMNSFHAPPPNTSADVTMPGLMHILDEIRKTNPSVVKMLCKSLKKYLEDRGGIPEALAEDRNYVVDMLPSYLIDDLRENVKHMVAGGFETQCSDEYSRWRREFLRECQLQFGLNELDAEEVDEEERIKMWIKLSNIAVSTLFRFERTLCDCIFSGFSSIADLSFVHVCSEMTSNLLNFANAYAYESPSLNLFPSIIQVSGAFHDLLPEIESMFSDQHGHSASLRTEAIRTSQRLWEALSHLFMELENLIRRDISQGRSFACIIEEVREYLSAVTEEVSSSHCVEVTRIVKLLDSHSEDMFKEYAFKDYAKNDILYELIAILASHDFRIRQPIPTENDEQLLPWW